MIPVTIDVIFRVLSHAFVFVFAPIVGGVGLLGKLLTNALTACFLNPTAWVRALFAGIITPIFYSEAYIMTKSSLKKYYAINRIGVSTILLIELATVLALTPNANDTEISSDGFSR